MIYEQPNQANAIVNFKNRYENYINVKWTPPIKGNYFDNPSQVTGENVCEVARSKKEDVELALDAAHEAKGAWAKASPTERANVLLKIAERIDEKLEKIAVAETWDNGKAVRETLNADIALAVDHFRYFASAIRALEGTLIQIDHDTLPSNLYDPYSCVGLSTPS